MTDHPNLEIARAGYEAFANGDLAAVSDLLSDDIVWHSGGDNILTGDYDIHWLEKWLESYED